MPSSNSFPLPLIKLTKLIIISQKREAKTIFLQKSIAFSEVL
jgi:hypothetical protein